MTFALALALLLPSQEETMEALLEHLRSGNIEERSRASDRLLFRFDQWKDEDLARLNKAAEDPDREVAERAKEAAARIPIRRKLGRKLLDAIPGIDEIFREGTDPEKLEALRAAEQLRRAGELKWADLDGVLELSKDLKEMPSQKPVVIPLKQAPRAPRQIVPKKEWLDPAMLVQQRDLANAQSLLKGSLARENVKDVLNLLQFADARVRWKAVDTLAEWGAKEHVKAIVPSLKDAYGRNRALAAATLGAFGAKECAGAVAPLLEDKNPEARKSAALALGRLGSAENARKITLLLQDPEAEVRLAAVEALGQLGPGEHAAAIFPLMKDADQAVTLAAAWVLGTIASKDLARQVVPLLRDSDPDVRHNAIWILSRIGAGEFADDIAVLLKDACSWVRCRSATAIGRCGKRGHVGKVATLLNDEDRKAKTRAAIALGELDARDNVRQLQDLERSADPVIRLSAAVGLLHLGKKDLPAQKKLLQEMASDSVASASFGDAFLEALARLHEKDSMEALNRPIDPKRSIESREDVLRELKKAALELEAGELPLWGRLGEGTPVTLRGALEWILGPQSELEVVVQDRKVRLVDRAKALALWRKRLDSK